MNLLRVLGVGVALLATPSLALAQQPIERVNKAIDAVGRSGLEQLKTKRYQIVDDADCKCRRLKPL